MPITSKQLLEESARRRSCRRFSSEHVDIEIIKDCIMTAGTAPSGANMQPWHFSVITDPAMKQRIRTEAEKVEEEFYKDKISDKWREDLDVLKTNASKPFLTEAPCLIAIFKEPYRIEPDGSHAPNYYVSESCGIAIGLLINALRNAGYDTLTYTPAPPTFLRELLNRPENETPVMVLVVGKKHADFTPPDIQRKSFDEIADLLL